MAESKAGPILGVDVGTECVKAVILDADAAILARSSTATEGYFETCIQQAVNNTLEEAKLGREDLSAIAATGFGAKCVSDATKLIPSSSAHAAGAYMHRKAAMTVVDIGGREIRAISVSADGVREGARGGRKCTSGIGSFLIFAARHLDVHPTRMQELAAEAKEAAVVSSYCTVFSSNELLERLRDGASREDVALGCMRAIAERIMELGVGSENIVITGGVPEYFPGVTKQLEILSGTKVTVSPDPIYAGAHGAALMTIDNAGKDQR